MGKVQKELISKECIECEGNFFTTNWRKKYCCQKCVDDAYRKKKSRESKNSNFLIYERDGFRCQYCGLTPQDNIKLSVDHIYPVSKGGSNDAHNLITSCQACNSGKHNKILDRPNLLRYWDVANAVTLDFNEAKELWDKKCETRKKLLLNKPKESDGKD